MTSTGVECLFALGRAHDKHAGACRDDTRSGVILGGYDDTPEWMRARPEGEAEWKKLRAKARAEMRTTMAEQRIQVGTAARAAREAARRRGRR